MKQSVERGTHEGGTHQEDSFPPVPEHTRQPKAVLSALGALGIVGPVLFTVGFLVQGFLRTDLRNGYNPIAQQISDLTTGPDGWVQQVNFIVFGLLLIAFAVGLQLGIGKAWPWAIGSALLAWNGVELVIAGIFPLREDATGHIFNPLGVHSVNGTIFFLGIGIVLGVQALHLAHDERWRDRSVYTLASGIVVFVLVLLNGLLAESVQAPLHPWLGLIQRAILAVWFPCLIVLAHRLWHLARTEGRRGNGEASTRDGTPGHLFPIELQQQKRRYVYLACKKLSSLCGLTIDVSWAQVRSRSHQETKGYRYEERYRPTGEKDG